MNRRKETSVFDKILWVFDAYPREYFVVAFFVLFFFAIIFETFSYTVLNYSFYSNLAEQQQTGESEIPVTRWSVYTSKSKTMTEGTVYSTSVDLMDIAVDPQIEWDIWKLWEYLRDLLYTELCYLKNIDDCYNDILRFSKIAEIEDFNNDEQYIKGLIESRLEVLLSETFVTSVRLRDWLSPDDERDVISWGIIGVYANENGLYVNPEEITQTEAFALKYQEKFWWTIEEILYSIRKREKRYIPIYQKLSLLNSDTIERYIEDEYIALKQWVLDKSDTIWGFIILTPHAQRIYPEREVWAQIVGFIDNAGEWHYWVEWFFEDVLRWNPWELVSKKDIKWRPIDPISFWEDNTSALEWVDIYTTIDRNVQKMVEQALEKWVKQYWANKWSIVVMEPKTWKVLSLANYPTYDPNNPWEVYDIKKVNIEEYPNPETDLLGKIVFVEDVVSWEPLLYNGKKIFLREATREEYSIEELDKYIYVNEFWARVYQNDAISSLYEPGSIMKAITVAIWIDTGEIRPYDMYNDIWKVTIDNFTISNVDSKCLWYNSFTHALWYSCNIWMIRIVQKVGKALMHKYFEDFWFSHETGIQLQWEVYSKMDPYEKWPTSRLLTTSYGLGISMTPLQMATAYSILANGGVYMKPYIVDKVVDVSWVETVYGPQPIRRVLKDSTSKSVTSMLVESVDAWVAGNGAVEWYSIAWKTGTSQIAYRWKYETGTASTYASFAWYAPAEDPQFVIVVKLDRPRTTIYWGASSAYIFSDITKQLLEYYSIPKKIIQN